MNNRAFARSLKPLNTLKSKQNQGREEKALEKQTSTGNQEHVENLKLREASTQNEFYGLPLKKMAP